MWLVGLSGFGVQGMARAGVASTEQIIKITEADNTSWIILDVADRSGRNVPKHPIGGVKLGRPDGHQFVPPFVFFGEAAHRLCIQLRRRPGIVIDPIRMTIPLVDFRIRRL